MPPSQFARALLAWYDREKRDLPWRDRPTPYHTLLSELMLQQTVVATVIPYFQRFKRLFPDWKALATAPEDAVMQAWAGLGYYARARNLQRAAQAVVDRHGGVLPADEAALRALPGVGEYTAAAVAAIAFGVCTFALDGNAARVMARLSGEQKPIEDPATRKRLRAFGTRLVPKARPGDFAQAVMELGATVCVPRNPRCGSCPVARACQARAQGVQADLPVRKPRLVKKKVAMLALAVQRQGAVLMVKHPAGKLLGGTWSLPLLDLGRDFADGDRGALSRWRTLLAETGISVSDLRPVPGEIRHIFTHLDVSARLLIGVPRGRLARGGDARFYTRDALPPQSSFSRKLLALLPS